MEGTHKPDDRQPVERHCCGCGKDRPSDDFEFDVDGIDSYGSWFLCRACDAGLRPFERAVLSILTRPVFENGLQPGAEFAAIERLLEKGGCRR